jgi:hypothetical protein
MKEGKRAYTNTWRCKLPGAHVHIQIHGGVNNRAHRRRYIDGGVNRVVLSLTFHWMCSVGGGGAPNLERASLCPPAAARGDGRHRCQI